MPLASALLLLLGLSAHGGWGCLQCDRSVQEALRQLHSALIPKRFHFQQLLERAQAVLLGMEGPFFRDYALNAFVGKVGACWRGQGFWHCRRWCGGGETRGVARGWGGRQTLWGLPFQVGRVEPFLDEDGGVPWLSEGPTGISSRLAPRDRSPGSCDGLYQEPDKPLNG